MDEALVERVSSRAQCQFGRSSHDDGAEVVMVVVVMVGSAQESNIAILLPVALADLKRAKRCEHPFSFFTDFLNE